MLPSSHPRAGQTEAMHPNSAGTVVKHETKRCPRCDASFVCRVGDVVNCQCSEVSIDTAGRERIGRWLSEHSSGDCLCAGCLRELAADA